MYLKCSYPLPASFFEFRVFVDFLCAHGVTLGTTENSGASLPAILGENRGGLEQRPLHEPESQGSCYNYICEADLCFYY